MEKEIIKIEKLNYKVGNRYLLKDINWSVKEGEHWLIFGLNGSGKTTLLSNIAGFGSHTDGEMEVFGEKYSEETTMKIRQRIGFVSSSFFSKYYKHETVLEIVLSGINGTLGLNFAISNQDVIKARKILDKLGMLDKMNQSFIELSKGEQQKVLIARALVVDPSILILDEPNTGLDIYAREQMMDFIKQMLLDKNIAIIYVTHYMEEVLEGFDKCMILKNGRISAIGETENILTNYFA